jgi:hypothetical protein
MFFRSNFFFNSTNLSTNSALIIRSVDLLTIDETLKTLECSGLLNHPISIRSINDTKLKSFHEQIKILSKTNSDCEKIKAAQHLIELIKANESIRNYIENCAKRRNIMLILYNGNNINQILQKLSRVNKTIDILCLTGGHGLANHTLSGLGLNEISQLLNQLRRMEIKISVIILGSCYSASFANQFIPLLAKDGVMLSDTLPCGGQNYYIPLLNFLCHKSQHILDSIQDNITIQIKTKLAELFGISQSTITNHDIEQLNAIVNIDYINAPPEKILKQCQKIDNFSLGIQDANLDIIDSEVLHDMCQVFHNQILLNFSANVLNASEVNQIFSNIRSIYEHQGVLFSNLIAQSFKLRSQNNTMHLFDDQILKLVTLTSSELYMKCIDYLFKHKISLFNLDILPNAHNIVYKLIQQPPEDLITLTDSDFRDTLRHMLRTRLSQELGIQGLLFYRICHNFIDVTQHALNNLKDFVILYNENVTNIMKYEKKISVLVSTLESEYKDLCTQIQLAFKQPLLTGMCITTRKGHTAQKLDYKFTGKPSATFNDDYINNRHTLDLLSKATGNHTLSSDILLVNCNSQIQLFNQLAFTSLKNESIRKKYNIITDTMVSIEENNNTLLYFGLFAISTICLSATFLYMYGRDHLTSFIRNK